MIFSNYARYHSNINIKIKIGSIETQNMAREVSFTTTKSEKNSIKLAITQTPYLYSTAILIDSPNLT